VAVLGYINSQNPPPTVRLYGSVQGTTLATNVMSGGFTSPNSLAIFTGAFASRFGKAIFNGTSTINWTYDFGGEAQPPLANPGGTTNHQFFVTLAAPLASILTPNGVWNTTTNTWGVAPITCATTPRRVDWATQASMWARTATSAAPKFSTALYGQGTTAGCGLCNINYDPWYALDNGVCGKGDCITLATVACAGLGVVGVSGTPCWAFSTPDTQATISSSTCTYLRWGQVTYPAWPNQKWPAWLNYTTNGANSGLNHFEGFFTVNDGVTKAFTVYPPGGPWTNQQYYYLQVMNSIAGLNQCWCADRNQTLPDGTVVLMGQMYPNCNFVPLPQAPGNP
jgi:hypothetical protein